MTGPAVTPPRQARIITTPDPLAERPDHIRFALIFPDTWTWVGFGLEVHHSGSTPALISIGATGVIGFPTSDHAWLVR